MPRCPAVSSFAPPARCRRREPPRRPAGPNGGGDGAPMKKCLPKWMACGKMDALGDVAQLVRALRSHRRGRGFEPLHPHHRAGAGFALLRRFFAFGRGLRRDLIRPASGRRMLTEEMPVRRSLLIKVGLLIRRQLQKDATAGSCLRAPLALSRFHHRIPLYIRYRGKPQRLCKNFTNRICQRRPGERRAPRAARR